MNWTRMRDLKGGYFAVGQTYGVKVGYRVYKTWARSPNTNPWVLEIDGVDADAKPTCKEAKEAAVAHHMARMRKSLADNTPVGLETMPGFPRLSDLTTEQLDRARMN